MSPMKGSGVSKYNSFSAEMGKNSLCACSINRYVDQSSTYVSPTIPCPSDEVWTLN